MRISAFRARHGPPPPAPQGPEGDVASAGPWIPDVGTSYELKSDGVLFLWATVPPFVLEAAGGFHTAEQERALRRAFLGWARRAGARQKAGGG
ncbi:MAG: hypothetical protein HY744_21820 [Deltaproteobacteria bacterium]|nr:hypothetical protein [Deltaproteobacteria bacterium]